jgi:CDP-glucose 4,6-dehydratase
MNIFKDKVVLVTGHTGFKGSWLSTWLVLLGAKVIGFSDGIPTTPSNFKASKINDLINDYRGDIRKISDIQKIINQYQPDIVFHLAAQSLVINSYESPLETFSTNTIGTANVLESIRQLNKKVVAVMITSDKSYDNVEWVWGYRETDKLGGSDPYSASKGMAELAIKSYFDSYFNTPDSNLRLGIARAGNVIGGGDWALNRIIPDLMSSWSRNKVVEIRSPHSTRPWQHVLEPLSGYLTLAKNLYDSKIYNGEAYNFGPSSGRNYSVSKLINEMSKHWDNVKWKDVSSSENKFHEAGLLKLNCDKALFDLNWSPTLNFHETVEMTAKWYKNFYQGNLNSMFDFTISQIKQYNDLAGDRDSSWMKK